MASLTTNLTIRFTRSQNITYPEMFKQHNSIKTCYKRGFQLLPLIKFNNLFKRRYGGMSKRYFVCDKLLQRKS